MRKLFTSVLNVIARLKEDLLLKASGYLFVAVGSGRNTIVVKCGRKMMDDFNKKYDDWFDAHGGFEPYESGRDAWNWQQQKIEQLQERIEELESVLPFGIKWMEEWLQQDLCECEYGHTCGRTERQKELEQMKVATQASVSGES